MGTPLLLYDGDCAFCTSCARFANRWIPTRAQLVPWQFADLERLGVSAAECVDTVLWVPDEAKPTTKGPTTKGPAAIAALLVTSTRAWRVLGRVLGSRPVLWLAWPAYRWVARHRHQMPGGTAACAIPRAEQPSSRAAAQREDNEDYHYPPTPA